MTWISLIERSIIIAADFGALRRNIEILLATKGLAGGGGLG